MRFALSGSLRAAVAAAAFVAFLAFAPAAARASGAPSIDRDVLPATLLIGTSAVFGVIDIVFLASERPMPIWLSIMQIGIAGVLSPVAALSRADASELKIAAGGAMLWFTAHGFVDLVRYPEYRREKLRERELERLRERCGIALEPRAHGALLNVYARL